METDINRKSRWSNPALIALGTLGWACGWTVGICIIENISASFGWLLMGIIVGLVTASVLRHAQPGLDGVYWSVIVMGWAIGGIAAGGVTRFDILRGWIAMGIVGGAITGAAILRRSRSRIVAGITRVAVTWLLAGIVGASFGSGRARTIGVWLGEMASGELQSFLVSGAIWAVAGGITGLIGCGLTLWQVRRREAPARSYDE
jgi:hypothetical protein